MVAEIPFKSQREPTPKDVAVMALDLIDQGRSDADLERAVLDAGASPRTAECAWQMVPMAYTHVLFRGTGVRFSAKFRLVNHNLRIYVIRYFSEEPVYTAAHRMAMERILHGARKQLLMKIASRSAEYQVIGRMVRTGSKLADLSLAPPIIPTRDPLPNGIPLDSLPVKTV